MLSIATPMPSCVGLLFGALWIGRTSRSFSTQRFAFSLVKSPVNRIPSAFRVTKIDIADSLGVAAILLVILMAVVFFAV
jgi:hypothetical protein